MILGLFDWLSIGSPDGVPLRWLHAAWQRAAWPDFQHHANWGAFDNRFPWDALTYSHDEYLVRRRAL